MEILNGRREKPLTAENGVVQRIAQACGGDVRKAINAVELLFSASARRDMITLEDAVLISQKSAMRYDRDGDEHFDILSAMMKSLLPAVRANMAAATILRAGGGDLMTVFGSSRSDSIYKHVVSPLCTRFVRTSNDKEVKIFDGGKLKAEVDVNPVKSVSRIGAGDNFNAGFLFALLRENVTGDALARGLSASTWRKMVQTGLDFSRESCRQIGNYIPRDYAAKLRDRK